MITYNLQTHVQKDGVGEEVRYRDADASTNNIQIVFHFFKLSRSLVADVLLLCSH